MSYRVENQVARGPTNEVRGDDVVHSPEFNFRSLNRLDPYQSDVLPFIDVRVRLQRSHDVPVDTVQHEIGVQIAVLQRRSYDECRLVRIEIISSRCGRF